MRLLAAVALAAVCAVAGLAVGGCGSDDGGSGAGAGSGASASSGAGSASGPSASASPGGGAAAGDPAVNPTPRPQSGDRTVAALGDSIIAGSPLYDPDPAVRAQLGARLDERSSIGYWFHAAHPRYTVRNCGVFGERTDQIAARLPACARGAHVLIVQGGINDIAQGRSVEAAAANLRAMYAEGRRLGLKVYAAEVLPWNNGHPQADDAIARLNRLIHEAAGAAGIVVFPWHRVLEDPAAPGRMRPALTVDGDHPSIEGYKRLAESVQLP